MLTNYSEALNATNTGNCSINITDCCGACGNSTSGMLLHDIIDYDAFAYIIVVLSFYALSMVLLMIKYVRREEEDISLDYYYTEFVKREQFQNPLFKNKVALQNATSSGLIEKALQVWNGEDSKLRVYQCMTEDLNEEQIKSQADSKRISSVLYDLESESCESSVMRVDSTGNEDDLVSETSADRNLLETIV